MKTFCVPVVLAEKLKKAAQRGEFDVESMTQMDATQRRALFEKYADKATATKIAAGFESAMTKEVGSGFEEELGKWAKETFTGSEVKRSGQKDIFQKITELNEGGLLTPTAEKAYLENLVTEKLGGNISTKEAKEIADKADQLAELASKVPNMGDPTSNQKEQLEYFKARREMENYLDSLTPSGQLKIVTSTIARGNMLARLGSILVNINSNNIEGVVGSIVRRINERSINGANTQYIGDMVKFYTKVYRETGYDLTRARSLESDRKVLGENAVTSQGKGIVRKIGRFYEDNVFALTQGLPDVVAASLAAGDRGNLASTRIAREEGLKGSEVKTRALEIVKDASLIDPQTKQGKIVREAMIADAERSTNTDERLLSERLLKLRNVLNVGDLRFGDLNIPFVKTTANSIQSALQGAGVTVPIEVPIRMIKMIKLVSESGNPGSKSAWGDASEEAFKGFSDTMIRAGLGSVVGFLIANAIKKENYMGVYPTSAKERELLELKNAVPNSIRIGDKWYSLDWFGPLAAPIIGHLNAKKYGKDIPSYLFYYGQGAGYQVLKAPGLDYVNQSYDSLKKVLTASTQSKPSEVLKDMQNYFVDYVAGRGIPGFIQEIAQFTDDVVRDTKSREDILAPIKSKLPGLRQTLPANKTIFAETTPTEGWRVLIFGGRVKTDQSSPITDELDRLNSAGQLPSITDVSKTSSRAKELKNQIGNEKFDEAMQLFGTKFKERLQTLIDREAYKNASDEKKSAAIDKIKNDLFDAVLVKYNYQKPKK